MPSTSGYNIDKMIHFQDKKHFLAVTCKTRREICKHPYKVLQKNQIKFDMDANRIVNFWVSISVILAKEKNPLNLRSQPKKSLILCYETVFLIVAFLSLINPWNGVLCGSDRRCSGDETNSRNTCILSEIWYVPVGLSDGEFRQSTAEMWQVTDNLLAIVMHSFND